MISLPLERCQPPAIIICFRYACGRFNPKIKYVKRFDTMILLWGIIDWLIG